jgi:hypothetical protein
MGTPRERPGASLELADEAERLAAALAGAEELLPEACRRLAVLLPEPTGAAVQARPLRGDR